MSDVTVEVTPETPAEEAAAGIDPVEFGELKEKCRQLEMKQMELEARLPQVEQAAEIALDQAAEAGDVADEAASLAAAAALAASEQQMDEQTGPIEEVEIPQVEPAEQNPSESEEKPRRRGLGVLL